jgi:hypothetical protein
MSLKETATTRKGNTNNSVKTLATNLKTPILFLSAFLVSLVMIRLRDPHIPGSFPECPSIALTGFYCAGCGSMRAMRDLTDGKIGEAFSHNILLPLAAAWLVWWFISYTGSKIGKEIKRPPSGYKFTLGLLIVIVVFIILRNIPMLGLAP